MNVEGSFQAAFAPKYVGMHPKDLAFIRQEIARNSFEEKHKAFVFLAHYAETISTDPWATQAETMKARYEAQQAGIMCRSGMKRLREADAKYMSFN
jgi:hypothetical protein